MSRARVRACASSRVQTVAITGCRTSRPASASTDSDPVEPSAWTSPGGTNTVSGALVLGDRSRRRVRGHGLFPSRGAGREAVRPGSRRRTSGGAIVAAVRHGWRQRTLQHLSLPAEQPRRRPRRPAGCASARRPSVHDERGIEGKSELDRQARALFDRGRLRGGHRIAHRSGERARLRRKQRVGPPSRHRGCPSAPGCTPCGWPSRRSRYPASRWRARFSSSTLTRGCPKRPSVLPSVCRSMREVTSSSERPRTEAILGA